MTIYHCRCFVTFGHNALEGISEAVLPHVQKFLLRLTSELRDLSLQNTSQTCALSSDSDHHLQFHIHENIIFNFSVTVHKNARRIKFETASQQQRSFFCISVYSEKHTYMWIFFQNQKHAYSGSPGFEFLQKTFRPNFAICISLSIQIQKS